MPLLIIIRFIPVRKNLNVTSVTKHAQRRVALKCIKRFILAKRNINAGVKEFKCDEYKKDGLGEFNETFTHYVIDTRDDANLFRK